MAKVVNMEKARVTKAELDGVRFVLRRAFSTLSIRSPQTALANMGRAVGEQRLSRSDPAKVHHAKETRRPGFSRELIREDDFGWSYVINAVADLPSPHHEWIRCRYMPDSVSQRQYITDCQHALYRQLEDDLKGNNKRDIAWWLVGEALTYHHQPHIIDGMEPWKGVKVRSRDGSRRPMTKSEWDKNYKRHWQDIRRLVNQTDRQALQMLLPIAKPHDTGVSGNH